MKSKARTVDAYLDEAPTERRAFLEKLRTLCKHHLRNYDESMDYGMPCYKRHGGEPAVAFASQRNYVSLYILVQEVMHKNAAKLKGYKTGKGCITLNPSKELDDELIRALLEDTAASSGKVC